MSQDPSGTGAPAAVRAVPRPLDARQAAVLQTLLELIVPYPAQPGGPVAPDTVGLVQRRLAAEDAAWVEPLRAGVAVAAGREAAWLAGAAEAQDESGGAVRAAAWLGLGRLPRRPSMGRQPRRPRLVVLRLERLAPGTGVVITDAPVDVVVVGLGAAGGTIAAALAERGLTVVGLEAGPGWCARRTTPTTSSCSPPAGSTTGPSPSCSSSRASRRAGPGSSATAASAARSCGAASPTGPPVGLPGRERGRRAR